MATIETSALIKKIRGKIGDSSIQGMEGGGMRTYKMQHPSTAAPTESMKAARNTFAAAQAYYSSIKDDKEKMDEWRRKHYLARREHEKHPGQYATRRRAQMEAAGKRVREKQLEFPPTLKGYIISCCCLDGVPSLSKS